MFEERVASLEGGVAALAVASGQAAETITLLNLAENGGHVVSSASLYGGTYNLLHYTLPKFGIEASFVDDPDDLDAWRAAIRPNTKAFFAETLGNPKGMSSTSKASRCGARAGHPSGRRQHARHALPGPAVAPWDRHRRALGHEIHRRSWHVDRRDHCRRGQVRLRGQRTLPRIYRTRPELSRACVRAAPRISLSGRFVLKARLQYLRDTGPSIAPLNSFLFLQGLETLSLRMERHVQNAVAVAEWLEGRDEVSWVTYPGLASSPWHERQKKYLPKGGGSIIAFGIAGGAEAGRRFIEGLELFSHLANVGDVRSLAIHPASTTHSQLTEAEQTTTGVSPDLREALRRNRVHRGHSGRPRSRIPSRKGSMSQRQPAREYGGPGTLVAGGSSSTSLGDGGGVSPSSSVGDWRTSPWRTNGGARSTPNGATASWFSMP